MTRSSKAATPPEISIVVPCYNESGGIERFFKELTTVLIAEKLDYEVLCVNDGSTDRTLNELLKARESNQRIRIIQLSRKFGKEVALTAGLDHARGRAVIPMDADLQDPPRLIPHLIARWREGYQVVHARRAQRLADSWLKRATTRAFHRVFNAVSDIHLPEDTGDFRLLDAEVVEALKCFPERERFMKGLFAWVGYRTTEVTYERPVRAEGTGGFLKVLHSASGGLIGFSHVPLRLFTWTGMLVALGGFLCAAFLVLRTLFFGQDIPGHASLMVAVLFLGGLQLIGIGVVGEYVGRTFLEAKQRPLYLVQKLYGFDADAETAGSQRLIPFEE